MLTSVGVVSVENRIGFPQKKNGKLERVKKKKEGISDKLSENSGVKLYDYLVSQRYSSDHTSWRMGSCSSGTTASGSFNNAQQNKWQKWDNRFSKKRIKCRGGNTTENKKFLKVYDICKSGCRYKNTTEKFILVNGTEKLLIGKMEANITTRGTKKDSSGNEVLKTKKKYLYFQIY